MELLSLIASDRYAHAMTPLADLVSYLDLELRVAEILDYPGANEHRPWLISGQIFIAKWTRNGISH
jgi:hypothetical protein